MEYIYINLLGHDTNEVHPYLRVIFFLVFLILNIGTTWTFFRVVTGLQEKSVSLKIERMFYTGIAVVGISYSVGITLYIQTASSKWLEITYFGLIFLSMVIIYIFLIGLVFRRHANLGSGKRKANRLFGILYLFYFTSFLISNLFPAPFNLYVPTGLLFYSNLIPLFWLSHSISKYCVPLLYAQDNINFDHFLKAYRISKREAEIIDLILQGKSNKEIEDDLFISFNTVKNHIYNLYQKLGINSRGQLVHLIRQAQKK